jgi:hypothetical protein
MTLRVFGDAHGWSQLVEEEYEQLLAIEKGEDVACP